MILHENQVLESPFNNDGFKEVMLAFAKYVVPRAQAAGQIASVNMMIGSLANLFNEDKATVKNLFDQQIVEKTTGKGVTIRTDVFGIGGNTGKPRVEGGCSDCPDDFKVVIGGEELFLNTIKPSGDPTPPPPHSGDSEGLLDEDLITLPGDDIDDEPSEFELPDELYQVDSVELITRVEDVKTVSDLKVFLKYDERSKFEVLNDLKALAKSYSLDFTVKGKNTDTCLSDFVKALEKKLTEEKERVKK